MKLSFNKYWILVLICIIGDVFIFLFLSKQLEIYVFNKIIEDQQIEYSI